MHRAEIEAFHLKSQRWLVRLRWLRLRLPRWSSYGAILFGAIGLWGIGDDEVPAAVTASLLVTGVALLLRDRGRRSWPRALSALVFALQTLVLLDQVPATFATDGWRGVLAGPLTLALACVALYVVDKAPIAAATLSSIVSTTSVVAVVGHLAGVPMPYSWTGFRSMALSSALALACLGFGIVSLSFRVARPDIREALRWAEIMAVAAAISGSTLLWLGLRSEAAAQRQRTIAAISHGMAGEVSARVRFMTEALERLALHGARIGGWESSADWARDARLTLASFSGYRSVRWADASLRTVLEAQAEGAAATSLRPQQPDDTALRPGLERARATGKATIVAPLELAEGGTAFSIVMPLAAVDQPEAFLIAFFSFAESSFGGLFENSAPDYDVALFAADSEVLRRGPVPIRGPTATSEVDLLEATAPWNLVAAPRPEVLASLTTRLPDVALGAGLLVALLLGVIIRLGGLAFLRAQRFELSVDERTAELETALDELRTEVAARSHSESVLRLTRQVERTLAAELDPRMVMQRVTDAVRQLSGADLALFLLPDSDAPPTSEPYAVSGTVSADHYLWVVRHQDAILSRLAERISLTDLETPDDIGGSAKSHPPGSLFAALVPSRVGTTRGALLVLHAEAGRFSAAEHELVSSLAAQAAIALDNARLYAAEKAARDEAQTASAAKDRFMRTLSHELRNPLGSMSNAVEALYRRQQGGDGIDESRMLGIVSRQMAQLQRMVEDLLDASRIDSGKISLELEPIEVGSTLRDIAEDHESIVEEAGLELELDLGTESHWVDGDRARLAQAVGNLISNAVKSTAAGGSITIALQRQGSDVVVAVRDTGDGIAPAHLPLLFEPFVQSETSARKRRGGLGLGLAIVRGLVNAHGGSVQASSEGPGKGAEFVIRLPARDAAAAAAPADESEPTTSKRRILIIDDHVDSVTGLAELLSSEGHHVETATDGTAGLAAARHLCPDLVLCDLDLPGLDGYGVARALRQDAELAHIRLVALSGFGDESAVRQARDSGFDEHVTKPIDPHYLRHLVATVKDSPAPSRSA